MRHPAARQPPSRSPATMRKVSKGAIADRSTEVASYESDPFIEGGWAYESDTQVDSAIAAMNSVDINNCQATDECTPFYSGGTGSETARMTIDAPPVTYFDAEGDHTVSCDEALSEGVVSSCDVPEGLKCEEYAEIEKKYPLSQWSYESISRMVECEV
mmetsp:Transcript_44941/g.123205  ORF Transcript_44941/g.123205 Transcript_44941/m.123205 type:complete len:158 (-) Transcript_44941:495-968(-)